jgi:hypothetical protein
MRVSESESGMANEGDLVLVYVENNPAFFAKIECISPDVKPDWYQVSLLVLQVPLVEVTWILRREYIDGTSFTMGGKKMLIEQVVAPSRKPPPEETDKSGQRDKQPSAAGAEEGKVISLFDRK